MAGQRSFSLAFNPDKEADLISLIEDTPTPTIKAALKFYAKYRHLLPELENSQDLLSVVSQMAIKQAELIALVSRLSERLNGLQTITASEVVNDDSNYDDMMEFD